MDDAGATVADAGAADAGAPDAGTADAGGTDAGREDAGPTDDAGVDAGGMDAGATDAGPGDAGSTDDAGIDAGAPDAGAPDAGFDAGPPPFATCLGQLYACGDTFDNDGDGLIDSDDPECTGACDNTESSLTLGIPGGNNAPCRLDCYFDQDTGAGNDACYSDQQCDPTSPNPGGSRCSYDPNINLGGGLTCSTSQTMQSAQCASVCGPLVPNGCDCFGCCNLLPDGGGVFLGATDCTLDGGCPACQQVTACLNTCERCELCLGKTSLPPDCFDGGAQPQVCPADAGACGLPGQPRCGAGEYCVTVCCRPTLN